MEEFSPPFLSRDVVGRHGTLNSANLLPRQTEYSLEDNSFVFLVVPLSPSSYLLSHWKEKK